MPRENWRLSSPIGLLLAAGRGIRFDASGTEHKLLSRLPSGRLCFEQSLANLLSVCSEVFVALPPVRNVHTARLTIISLNMGATPVHAPHAELGMGESLSYTCAYAYRRVQIEAKPRPVMVHLADMPWVLVPTLRSVASACTDASSVVAASYQGQRANPVAFGSNYWNDLRSLSGDSGARQLIKAAARAQNLTLIEVDDSGVLRDIDHPQDIY